MGISDGHLQCLVAQELLNRAQVDPSHYKAAGKGMPQAMPSEALQIRRSDGWLEPVTRPRERAVAIFMKEYPPCSR